MQYRPEIDGLRSLAIVPVILFHSGVTLFSGGFIGVDIFFVISGFLITSIIGQELEQGRFSYSNFYYRRAKRILPALFVVMFITLPFAFYWMLPGEYASYAKSLVYVSLFVSNFLFWKQSGYFEAAAEEKPLLHTWSLSVEEQYYVMFPVLLVALWRFGRNPVMGVILVLGCLSLWLSHWGAANKPEANFYLLVSRAWELFAGALAALLLLKKQPKGNGIYASVGLVSILVAIFLYDRSTPIPSLYALLPVCGTVLVLVFARPNTWVYNILSQRLFTYIGLISYSLYLWHQPILAFARLRHYNLESHLVLFVAFALTTLLAMATYHYVERPIKTAHFFSSKTRFFSLFGMILMGFVGYGTLVSNTSYFAEKYPNATDILEEMKWPAGLSYDRNCRKKFGADQYCLIGKVDAPVTAALIGDSHANHFYWGLNDSIHANGGNLLLVGAGACPPFFGANRGFHPEHGYLRCYARTKKLYDFVIGNPNIKQVFIAFRGEEYLREDIGLFDTEGEIVGKNNGFIATSLLVRTIERLQKADKQVILIEDLPDLSVSLKDCIKAEFVLFLDNGCLQEKPLPMGLGYTSLINAARKIDGVRVFPTSLLSQNEFPYGERGLMYRDSTHLSYKGSMFFSPHFQAFLAGDKGWQL